MIYTHVDICFYKSKMHSHSKLKKPRRLNKVYLKSAKKSLVQGGSQISGFCFNHDQGLKASSTRPEPNFFFSVPYPLLPRAQNKRLGWDNEVTGN